MGISAEGLYYVQFEQLGCEMVWPQSLSLSLWRVWELVYCMERGYDLILHGTSMVYTGVSIYTKPLMIPAYNFIVVGSPLLLCSPWPVSIWARSRVVIYVRSSRLRFLLICVEHHFPSISEVTLTKVKFLSNFLNGEVLGVL